MAAVRYGCSFCASARGMRASTRNPTSVCASSSTKPARRISPTSEPSAYGTSARTLTSRSESACSIAAKSSSIPSPVRAETRTAPMPWAASCIAAGSAPAATASVLFQTGMTGTSSAPMSASTASTAATCAPQFGLETSTTCSKREASAISSRVALNAATSWVGSFEMNPTVSVTSAVAPVGSASFRVVGSSVAKSLSSARTPASVNRFRSVLFPAFV
mmetsp:Transcript_14948/g.49004  ORF Transcript_14948/g.49004 Transcript_14948/m.49004 type:complete len:218 (-) Transcript_14948:677-1330(-)